MNVSLQTNMAGESYAPVFSLAYIKMTTAMTTTRSTVNTPQANTDMGLTQSFTDDSIPLQHTSVVANSPRKHSFINFPTFLKKSTMDCSTALIQSTIASNNLNMQNTVANRILNIHSTIANGMYKAIETILAINLANFIGCPDVFSFATGCSAGGHGSCGGGSSGAHASSGTYGLCLRSLISSSISRAVTFFNFDWYNRL